MIVAAIITGGFGLLKSSGPVTTVQMGDQHDGSAIFAGDANDVKVTTIRTGNQHDGSFVFTGDSNDITIYYNVEPSKTKEAIEALENRLKEVRTDISLTREELEMLTVALKDLDQRTSGIEKLPDGRTRIGRLIAGHPTIVVEEHNAAAILYRKKDFVNALEHSKCAIQAHEESQQEGSSMKVGGNLNESQVATMYYVGALSAHKLKKHEQAYEWAEKANNHESNPKLIAFLSVTLYNVNRKVEALQMIDKRLVQDPNSSILVNVRDELSKRIMTRQDSIADPQ